MRRLVAVVLALGVMVGTAACQGDEEKAAAQAVKTRQFGIATDPWKVDGWATAVGARPTMVMEFEQWSRNRTIDSHLKEAHDKGLTSFMISWEPWKSVPAEQGKTAQYAEQPAYTNANIAAGKLDDYIRTFARSIKKAKLVVYMRYAHEMNGDWYPWSRDPAMYVQAWQHVVKIFREEGAANAKWVFSLNPSPYEPEATWLENVRKYWPGPEYVDYLGSTMINFGGSKQKSVQEFAQRLTLMRTTFGKDMLITELNTADEGRVKWLTDLRSWLVTDATWVRGMVLSQQSSRGQAQLGSKVGDLSWNVTTDPATKPVVKALVTDLTSMAVEPAEPR